MQAIIFCGIQATGKSSFYKDNFFKTHVHISLDLLKTRNRESKFIDVCFQTNQPFVIDNTNPTKAERAKYISQAKEHNFKVIGYYFSSSISEAIARNEKREGISFVPIIAIKGTYNKLEIPNFSEGFDKIFYVELTENQFIIKEWKDEI